MATWSFAEPAADVVLDQWLTNPQPGAGSGRRVTARSATTA